MTTHIARNLSALSLAILVGCSGQPTPGSSPATSTDKPGSYSALKRADFNRRAAEKFLPLFWREDTNKDGALQPGELAVLWGYRDSNPSHWVGADQQFTPQFDQAYKAMLQPDP